MFVCNLLFLSLFLSYSMCVGFLRYEKIFTHCSFVMYVRCSRSLHPGKDGFCTFMYLFINVFLFLCSRWSAGDRLDSFQVTMTEDGVWATVSSGGQSVRTVAQIVNVIVCRITYINSTECGMIHLVSNMMLMNSRSWLICCLLYSLSVWLSWMWRSSASWQTGDIRVVQNLNMVNFVGDVIIACPSYWW